MAFTWQELIVIENLVGRCQVDANELNKKKKIFAAIKRELALTLIGPSLPIKAKEKK